MKSLPNSVLAGNDSLKPTCANRRWRIKSAMTGLGERDNKHNLSSFLFLFKEFSVRLFPYNKLGI